MAALTRLVKLTSTISDLFVTRSLSTTTGKSSANLSDGKGPGSRNFQWVFLGVPGVGKGTYASRLCNLLGVSHVAIGDLVWHELDCKGPLFIQLAAIVNKEKIGTLILSRILCDEVVLRSQFSFNVASLLLQSELLRFRRSDYGGVLEAK
ncbi:adenylate kinase 1, chloroplastic [Tanacetum coccineum]